MAYSSILGADTAPTHPSGREAELLGPSDNSDSGSDTVGTHEPHADSDARGTGERGAVAGADAREGGDIMPDRIVNLADGEVAAADLGMVDPTADLQDFTDLDDGSADADAETD